MIKNEMIIVHITPPCDVERVYNTLIKINEYMIPKLSKRVDIKEYAKKLALKADHYYVQHNHADCGHCAIYFNKRKEAYISSFGVFPSFQGQGIAGMLLRHVLCEAELKGIKRTGLEVWENNAIAINLYSKAGFQKSSAEGNFIQMVRKQSTII